MLYPLSYGASSRYRLLVIKPVQISRLEAQEELVAKNFTELTGVRCLISELFRQQALTA